VANDSFTQQALAANLSFQTRVRNALATVAWQVLNEAASTPNNAARVLYARSVIYNLTAAAIQISPWLVDRPNVFQFETSFDFPSNDVVSATGDADIESQLATDWDVLSGVFVAPPQP
jgi:hypothetical protein